MSNYLKIAIVIAVVGAFAYGMFAFDIGRKPEVTDFITCVAAENLILESYPRQCRDADGFIYVEVIATTTMSELIVVDSPSASSSVPGSFLASGKARGQWFFEASFPVKVFGDDGRELGGGIGQAEGDWMVMGFVPFTASIDFDAKGNSAGFVRFMKDNPSGLPELDAHFDVPVRFDN